MISFFYKSAIQIGKKTGETSGVAIYTSRMERQMLERSPYSLNLELSTELRVWLGTIMADSYVSRFSWMRS